MSRRGKDDGFHPHPGDPWHPGWSSDDEPVFPDQETPAAGGPVESGESRPGGAAPPPGEEEGATAEPAGHPPVAPTAGAAPGEAPGGSMPREPTLFDQAEPDTEGPSPSEAVDFAAGPTEPVEEEPVEVAAQETPAEGSGTAEEGELEVDEWLAFAAGPTEPVEEEPAAGPLPPDEGVVGEVEVPPPVGSASSRWWPFGRRRREAAEPGAWAEEPAVPPAEEVLEEALPPPWSPEGEWAEDRATPAPVGPEAGPGDVTGPTVEEGGEPVPPPWMPQADLDRAAPVPVVPGPVPEGGPEVGRADRGTAGEAGEWGRADEVVPTGPPAEEWGEESTEADRREEEEWGAEPEGSLPAPPEAAAERAAAAPPPSPEEEAEEAAWAEFAGWESPAAGRPSPAAPGEPPPVTPGIVGAPTAEMPAPALFDFARPHPPGHLLGEEIFAGAVTAEHRHLAEEVAAADTSEAQLQALSAPMPGLESGVVGFEDVVQPGGEEEPAESGRSDLPVRVVTSLVLVGILLGSLWVGGELLAGLVGVLALLALAEFYGTLRRRGYAPLAGFGFVGAIGMLIGTWFLGLVAIPVAVIGVTVVSFFYYSFASRRREPFTNGSLTTLGLLWIPGTLAFAFPLAAAPDFRVLVLAVVATVVATDVGAFFAGRSWGSRSLAPVLSPRKTVEGLAGGVVLGIAVAVILGYFLKPLNLRIGAGLGLVVAVMAPLGDLAESMLKRSLGVKDMGSILPGHGGVLDRLDAFLFVLPATWVLYETLGLLR